METIYVLIPKRAIPGVTPIYFNTLDDLAHGFYSDYQRRIASIPSFPSLPRILPPTLEQYATGFLVEIIPLRAEMEDVTGETPQSQVVELTTLLAYYLEEEKLVRELEGL